MLIEKRIYEEFAKTFVQKVYDPSMQNMESLIDNGIGNLSTIEALRGLSKSDKELVKCICSQVIELALGNTLCQLKEAYYDENLKIYLLNDGCEYDIMQIAQQHTYGHIDGEFYIEGGWIDRYSKLSNNYRYFHEDRNINPLKDWWVEEVSKKVEDIPKTEAEWSVQEIKRLNIDILKKNKIQTFGGKKANYNNIKKMLKDNQIDDKNLNDYNVLSAIDYLGALYAENIEIYMKEVEALLKIKKGLNFKLVFKALESIGNDYRSAYLNNKYIPMVRIEVLEKKYISWYIGILEELECMIGLQNDIQDTNYIVTEFYQLCIYGYSALKNNRKVEYYLQLIEENRNNK